MCACPSSRCSKGEVRRSIVLTILGGSVDGVRLDTEDAPRFVDGGVYTIFLTSKDHVLTWCNGAALVVAGGAPP